MAAERNYMWFTAGWQEYIDGIVLLVLFWSNCVSQRNWFWLHGPFGRCSRMEAGSSLFQCGDNLLSIKEQPVNSCCHHVQNPVLIARLCGQAQRRRGRDRQESQWNQTKIKYDKRLTFFLPGRHNGFKRLTVDDGFSGTKQRSSSIKGYRWRIGDWLVVVSTSQLSHSNSTSCETRLELGSWLQWLP